MILIPVVKFFVWIQTPMVVHVMCIIATFASKLKALPLYQYNLVTYIFVQHHG